MQVTKAWLISVLNLIFLRSTSFFANQKAQGNKTNHIQDLFLFIYLFPSSALPSSAVGFLLNDK